MSETENDYVATATAEKRLREVLAERLGGPDSIDGGELAYRLGDILLAVAEITYLPRKKSVSITLRIPETAPTPKATNGSKNLTEEQVAAGDGGSAEYGGPPDAPNTTPKPQPDPRGARFGVFEPTVTSAPEYHEDDYFVE